MDRFIGERSVDPSAPEFWQAQRRDFEAAVDRFTRSGAILVVVVTERPRVGVMSRPEADFKTKMIDYSIKHDEYRQRFNDIVRQVAAGRSDVSLIEGDTLFCGARPSVGPGPVCDDTVDGHLMRPDGFHVDEGHFGERVVSQILDEIDRVQSRP